MLTRMQPVLYTMVLFSAGILRGDCRGRKTELEACAGPAMTSRGGAQQIGIRDLKSIDDLSQLKAVEKEVWGMADEDTLPPTLAISSSGPLIGITARTSWSGSPSDFSAARTDRRRFTRTCWRCSMRIGIWILASG